MAVIVSLQIHDYKMNKLVYLGKFDMGKQGMAAPLTQVPSLLILYFTWAIYIPT